jgi:hypothetical protein
VVRCLSGPNIVSIEDSLLISDGDKIKESNLSKFDEQKSGEIFFDEEFEGENFVEEKFHEAKFGEKSSNGSSRAQIHLLPKSSIFKNLKTPNESQPHVS